MRHFSFNYTLFLLLLFCTLSQSAKSSDITIPIIKASLSEFDSLLIGDHISLNLSVKSDKSAELLWPQLIEKIGDFEIVKTSKIDTSSENEKNIYNQTVIVSAYDSGSFRIDPILFVSKSSDGKSDSFFSQGFIIPVYTLAVDTAQPIKDIKPLKRLPLTFKEILPYLLIGLAILAFAALVLYFILRRKPEYLPYKKQIQIIPAHITAKKKLHALEEEKLWQKDETKLHYVKLSEIVREYIENRYQTLALESTTDEILADLKKFDLSTELLAQLEELLMTADLVKFAKMKPLPNENTLYVQRAFDFVDKTEPLEVETKFETVDV